MSRALALLAAALIASRPSIAFATASSPASVEEIRRTLAAYAKAHPKTLVAVETMSGGSFRTYFARGSQEDSFPLDDRTLFEIGSITKTFTATLLAQMVQNGSVRLNDPIQKYLPPGVVAPTFKGTPITLASLAEHRSGLPVDPPNLTSRDSSNPYAGYTTAMLYNALAHFKLTRAPGTRYEYSNFAYGLLGQILADRAREPFAALVDQRILRPLGMRDTVVLGSPFTRRRLAPAFTYGGAPQGQWDFGSLSPAGSMESNLHDMLVYLRANMNAPEGPLGRALSFAQQSRVPEDDEDSLGLAWETNRQYHFVHNAGGTGGYSAWIIFNRHAHYGMVFLANVANSADLGQLVLHLIKPAAVAAPTEWAVQTPQSSPEKLLELKRGRYSWDSVKATITFSQDRSGRVTGLAVLQDGQTTRAQKQP